MAGKAANYFEKTTRECAGRIEGPNAQAELDRAAAKSSVNLNAEAQRNAAPKAFGAANLCVSALKPACCSGGYGSWLGWVFGELIEFFLPDGRLLGFAPGLVKVDNMANGDAPFIGGHLGVGGKKRFITR